MESYIEWTNAETTKENKTTMPYMIEQIDIYDPIESIKQQFISRWKLNQETLQYDAEDIIKLKIKYENNNWEVNNSFLIDTRAETSFDWNNSIRSTTNYDYPDYYTIKTWDIIKKVIIYDLDKKCYTTTSYYKDIDKSATIINNNSDDFYRKLTRISLRLNPIGINLLEQWYSFDDYESIQLHSLDNQIENIKNPYSSNGEIELSETTTLVYYENGNIQIFTKQPKTSLYETITEIISIEKGILTIKVNKLHKWSNINEAIKTDKIIITDPVEVKNRCKQIGSSIKKKKK